MPNSVSIQFAYRGGVSAVLFSHWGGIEFVEEANEYARCLIDEAAELGDEDPLYRLEPKTVIVDFIRHVTRDLDRVVHDLYLGVSEKDGDNGTWGHHVVRLD
jgi:hypothetical protein